MPNAPGAPQGSQNRPTASDCVECFRFAEHRNLNAIRRGLAFRLPAYIGHGAGFACLSIKSKRRAMSTHATLHIIGGHLDGQEAPSCPPGYHLQSFFLQQKHALAFVSNETSFEDARTLLIGRTRTARFSAVC